MSTLRIWDPLGVFVGKLRPDARRLSLSRRICSDLDGARLAQQLSDLTKRDFQRAGFLLAFLHRVAPRKFESVVSGIDLDRLGSILSDEWRDTPMMRRYSLASFIQRSVAAIESAY